MEFTLPTTKEEMYATLKQLFHYYRIEREGYAGVTLEELNLDRLVFEPLTDEQLSAKAQTALGGEHEREITAYKRDLESKIAQVNAQISALNAERTIAVEQVSAMYLESEDKVEKQAVKNGLINSSIVVDKLTALETAKNNKISEVNSFYSEKISSANAELGKLNAENLKADEYFTEIHNQECGAKVLELKDKQNEISRNVFKYNNSLQEKELKYRNSMAQSSLELKLKFMEIQSGEFTKDELVNMGYYDDVIECVTGYYNTLSALTAYQDIVNEERLMIFLDDYYQNVVYMYKLRAGA